MPSTYHTAEVAYQYRVFDIWSVIRYGPASDRTMYDYGFFSYESKDDFLDRSREFWNPDKTDFWQDAGVDLVIDRLDELLDLNI